MKLRYLWLSVLATVSIVAAASAATYTVEPTTPSHDRSFVRAEGVTPSPVFLPKSKIPDIPLTPPLLAPPIESYNFDTNPILNGFYLIPPDPHCAVGPDHVVNIGNCVIEWRPKVGTVDLPQYQSSLAGFFAGTAGMLAGDIGFDPKVIYDQYNSRFVVVTLQQWDVAFGDPSSESRILVAVSKASDPNLGWWTYSINSKLLLGGIERWADYPGLAVDDKAVYVTNNMFAFAAGGGAGIGSRLWIINKVPTYAGGGIAFTVNDPYGASPGSVNTTTQPAHMFGPPPVDGSGRPLGTFLVSYSGLNDGVQNAVQVIAVSDPLGGGGGPFYAHQFVAVGVIDQFAGALLDAPQLGTVNLIEVNDRRALNAVWRNNKLYMVAELRPPAGNPEFNQTTAHYWHLNTVAPVPGLTLTDQGNVGAEDLGAGTYVYYPSIMVDCGDNLAIGFSASNAAIYGGAYYATRLATDPPGSFGATGTLQVGLDFYNRRFGAANRNRWGDYSGIAVCPNDESTFYVYNEYAGPRGTILGQFPLEDGRFHTKLGWFQIEPCKPISVAITKFDATVIEGAVSIKSEFRSDLGVEAVDLYRAAGGAELTLIETSFDAVDRFEFTDRTVVPGTTYRYQIGVRDGDGVFRSPIVTVNVPESGTTLLQNTPNPFNPITLIRYQLAEREHVTLAVYDANGQRVRSLVDEVRPLGNNEVVWDGRSDAGSPVGSGVYFYRLTTGKFSEARKMVLLK